MLSERTVEYIRGTNARRLVVGFSGGVDSHVLLDVLVHAGLSIELHALHINHGLDSRAMAWEDHCRQVCNSLEVGFSAIAVDVEPGPGVESRARDARYKAFVEFLRPGDLLLLAHHADDQVETALLTLFRGGNRPGLAGMPRERRIGSARLMRPLLDRTRLEIEQYANSRGIVWVSDASNADIAMNRNFIRHQVLPVIRHRWPEVSATILREMERDGQFSQLVDYLGEMDLTPLLSDKGGASVAGLLALAPERRANAVRWWLDSFGLPIPGNAVLSKGFDELLTARADAAPQLSWQGFCLRRHADLVYLTCGVGEVDANATFTFGESMQVDLEGGILSAKLVEGRGLEAGALADVVVRFRRGGERMRLGKHRTLKNVFQEQGVPSWMRESIPLVYVGDRLAALPGMPAFGVEMVVADEWKASGSLEGIEFSFTMPGQPYSH